MENYGKKILILDGFYKDRTGEIVDCTSKVYYQVLLSPSVNNNGILLIKKEELNKGFKILEKS